MEIGAHLHHLEILTGSVDASVDFYARNYGLTVAPDGERRLCVSQDCRLIVTPGSANQLGFTAFAFSDEASLQAYRSVLSARTPVQDAQTPLFSEGAFSVTDPDGNCVVFGYAAKGDAEPLGANAAPHARLQHYAIRSPAPQRLVAFYRDVLGFVVSDQVFDDESVLRAAFLRTDPEHHALAIFLSAGISCLDHISFDTEDWTALRNWADRLAGFGVPMAWGVGRHGPGNDVFFMVRDPDGNLVEISSEMEVCAAERPEGRWPNEERTLNLWGKSILRS